MLLLDVLFSSQGKASRINSELASPLSYATQLRVIAARLYPPVRDRTGHRLHACGALRRGLRKSEDWKLIHNGSCRKCKNVMASKVIPIGNLRPIEAQCGAKSSIVLGEPAEWLDGDGSEVARGEQGGGEAACEVEEERDEKLRR
jgi:hypothetical protein